MRLGLPSMLIIGLIVVGTMATSLTMFYKHMYDSYPEYINDYNSTQYQSFDRMNELKPIIDNSTSQLGVNVENPRQSSGGTSILDVVGGFFRAGVNSVKMLVTTVSVYDSMVDSAGNSMPVDVREAVNPWISAIKYILLVMVIFGVILAIYLKWVI